MSIPPSMAPAASWETRRPRVPLSEGSVAGQAWADFWTRLLFWAAPRFPRLLELAKHIFLFFAVRSEAVYAGPARNARRIFNRELSPAEERAFARAVAASVYSFVVDIGRSVGCSRAELMGRIAGVENREAYQAARAGGGGAIILSAHMGSFEVGIAALAERESRINVVFKRDVVGHFEKMRQQLRRRLGVVETAIEEDPGAWARLRDALRANELVVIQGDRVMGGQKGLRVAFLGGHLLLPTGPAKLALVSGAPMIPIFAFREAGGMIRIRIEEAICVAVDRPAADAVADAIRSWAKVLERAVAAHPEQWLMLRPAFCEDSDPIESEGHEAHGA